MDAKELDRLTELANIGAGHAASAFSTLTGETIWIGVPRVCKSTEGSLAESQAQDHDWSTGVFFWFEGCLDALVGILFRADASEAVVRRVVSMEDGEIPAQWIESALMEVGNILASHVASAIADTLGERLLPSIPTLAMNHADDMVAQLLREGPGLDALRIECELIGAGGAPGGLLMMVPTRPAEL